jgi:hypothetical protein
LDETFFKGFVENRLHAQKAVFKFIFEEKEDAK